MKMLDSVWLSIVEGVTEFLPVSSTGHMILARHFLGLNRSDALDAFLVIVQAGAILAVISVFWPTLLAWLKAWLALFFRKADGTKASLILARQHSLYFAFSVVPFAVFGFIFKDFVKSLFEVRVVAYALLAGGILILVDEWFLSRRRAGRERSIESLGFFDALIVGLGQCCALWPGFSRSAATILFGRWRGFSRTAAAEISFLVGLPTLCGTALYEAKSSWHLIDSELRVQLGIGILVSWFTAYICVKGFLAFLKRFPLTVFAYYRIIVAALLLYFIN
ncbi:MAG: undecaprenyl-diphosphate phosphatase [Proteobacteria bacterium]|nr:undecaprenyl-diphosphate phosphatase [Pseudomonadota bacterium]